MAENASMKCVPPTRTSVGEVPTRKLCGSTNVGDWGGDMTAF
ncbi:predicted protein [Sclerotinia sclerotiorum 1980 UF-70]|uniref:Uncharacterized protein n=1 Tax=Sclerotinia sclerotiorum (strain ATCC 18683 / 1980 / Ss-1) TaxID=665079 RepID=A7EET9_SCLS1|nr:predicted protein [Sclerotinia sclerotiorum 1980 UF-70]EDO01355.1 predicted protein [Sclerotinia sclerotiorum 1980 UF-70]